MYIVPIIKDGKMMKRHTEYAITNKQWKLMDRLGLWDYLTTLSLTATNSSLMRFAGIRNWYLRTTHNEVNSDPWNRVFKCFPPDKFKGFRSYEYQCFDSRNLHLKVCVIVTTVNSEKVYCVDAMFSNI